MITNKDIEKLKETFATKEDLSDSAENIKRYFDVIAEDLKNSISLLAEQISSRNNKIEEHEEKLEHLDTDVSILDNRVSVIETKIGK